MGLLVIALTLAALPLPLFLSAPSAQAFQEEGGYEAPDDFQKEQLRYLERNISEVSRKIETYYKFLNRVGIAGDDVRSRIPLEATMRTEWGIRERRVYSGTMHVEWNGGRIVSVMFNERKAVRGSGNLLRKTWYIREIGKRENRQNAEGQQEEVVVYDGISVNVVIGEKAGSLYTRYYNYRFYTGRDLRDNDRDVALPEYAAQKDSPVLMVRSANQRIKMLREYLSALRLLERRVNYLAYTQLRGEESLLNK